MAEKCSPINTVPSHEKVLEVALKDYLNSFYSFIAPNRSDFKKISTPVNL